jgi:cytidylate kinase
MKEKAAAAAAGDGASGARHGRAPMLIAVDGSAASGKSSVGRMLAERLGYRFLDTGIMYRAITWAALQRGIDSHDSEALAKLASSIDMRVVLPMPGTDEAARIRIDGVDVTDKLRSPALEDVLSAVSKVAGVREALVRRQKEIAANGRIVMAGRDIGTVVLPDAPLKLYLDASLEERAKRRHADFVRVGHESSEEAVLEDLRRRDQIDSGRELSPMKPADDAVVIDTDGMTMDDVLARALALAEDAA